MNAINKINICRQEKITCRWIKEISEAIFNVWQYHDSNLHINLKIWTRWSKWFMEQTFNDDDIKYM